MAIDQTKLQALLGRAVVDIGANFHAALMVTGDKLGLFRALRELGPTTPADLAKRTGTHERYIREWLLNHPSLGDHYVGGLRHPVVLPVSLSILLFGDSEATVAIPAISYALGSVLIIYAFMRALTDRGTAILASVVFAASPLLGELSTTVGVDSCELFLLDDFRCRIPEDTCDLSGPIFQFDSD